MSHAQHHHHQHDETADTADMAALLDLDAEVLQSYLAGVVDWVHDLAGAPEPDRILDLGAGTGTGALALARRFTGAEVVAVDVSAAMLQRLRHKAAHAGLADRIRTVEADLDGDWPDLGPAGLVWASNSLHHMADPDRALTLVLAALRPGGRLALAEMAAFPRFLPEDLGDGLETRCHAALAGEMPHLGADWSGELSKAGFTVEAARAFPVELTAPLPPAAGRYAQLTLARLRAHLEGRLDATDLALLDTLVADNGPASVLHRDDLTVRAARTVWVARRP